jgi:hypothetical protein
MTMSQGSFQTRSSASCELAASPKVRALERLGQDLPQAPGARRRGRLRSGSSWRRPRCCHGRLGHGHAHGDRCPLAGDAEEEDLPPTWATRSLIPMSPIDRAWMTPFRRCRGRCRDGQDQLMVDLRQADLDARRICMADDVRERLLEDAEAHGAELPVPDRLLHLDLHLARMPVRSWKSMVCHSMAAASPRLSSTPGRSSVAIRRTVWIVVSTWADMALILRLQPAVAGDLSGEP